MKFIKQTSTNKIVYRESPHTDKTLANAVIDTGILESDLEVVDQNLTDEGWSSALFNQKSYSEKRRRSYPPIGDQLDALWKGGAEADAMKVLVNKVKTDNPKE